MPRKPELISRKPRLEASATSSNTPALFVALLTALPIMLRPHSDFIWQRHPFMVGTSVHMEGWRQYSGNDLSEPYWNARRYGFLTEGAGQVLAWRDEGATCE